MAHQISNTRGNCAATAHANRILPCIAFLNGKLRMVIHWGRHSKTAKLEKIEVVSRQAFFDNFIRNPIEGKKGGPYFTTASEVEITEKHRYLKTDHRATDHYRRNNQTHKKSWCVVIDGDRRTDIESYCISPKDASLALQKLNINHIVYTTASHKPKKPKWRLIAFCDFGDVDNLPLVHHATVTYLYKLLRSNGCKLLKEQAESFVLSQMWFLPIETEENQCYFYNSGNDLEPQYIDERIPENSKIQISEYQSYEEIIDVIVKGTSPLHTTIGKYIWGAVRDGRSIAEITATLHGLTSHYNGGDKRLKDRKNDIARRVEAAKKKFMEETYWEPDIEDDNTRVYTRYPDQGGNFERLVQLNMKRMVYPNRPIAVTAARFQISVLGGRVYTGLTGKGLVQTILLTGRSTIGKSFIKKNSVWLFDNILMNKYSYEFMGASYYTSVKNFVEDANGRYSLGSIRTESGQSDKSKAGDMNRVLMYELEAATESGEMGMISSGAQNERVPPLFSPAITTIRESVAEIQNEADVLLQTSIAGVEGRRSYVVADPKKPLPNNELIEKIPKEDKEWLSELLTLCLNDSRKKWDEPLNPELWIRWQFADMEYLKQKQRKWIDQENEAHKERDMYSTTIFGRMIERVPAYAALLAVCENPKEPIITNDQIDIAEKSIVAEMLTHRQQHTNGDLIGPWGKLEKKMREIFSGDMKRHVSKYDKRLSDLARRELELGCMEWTPITRILQKCEEFRILKETRDFPRLFDQQAETWNIVVMKAYDTKNQFGHQRKTYKRV